MRSAISGLLFFAAVAIAETAHAAPLTYVSDLISQSAPSATTTHRVRFTAATAIPPSGTITISSDEAAFTIPVGFDVSDVDFAVATSSAYVDRPLAGAADAVNDGVVITTGSSGTITITLNSTEGVDAGDRVEIELGTNATYGVTGDSLFTNPSAIGAYRIHIRTADSGDTTLDRGTAMIALIAPVGVHVFAETLPPQRSEGLPSGSIAAGNPEIEISLRTDELATCRYATTTGVTYGSMTGAFSSATSLFHTVVIYDHQDDTEYHYYVRCADYYGITNDDDYEITFTLDEEATVGVGGSDGAGGVGSIIGGSMFLFQSSVTLSGLGPPSATITVLRDGKPATTVQSNAAGAFSATVSGLERGTYTFTLYADDRDRRRSSSHAVTLTLGQGTSNTLTDIILPPTISVDETTVGIGDDVRVYGHTVPGQKVELTARLQGGGLGSAVNLTASSTVSADGIPGAWEMTIPGARLSRGTYAIRAQAFVGTRESRPGGPLYLGVGEAPSVDLINRSDLNKDGKVNLVDFSILLSQWNTDDAIADINEDGIVNLSDVSIMLFNWTG